MREWLKKIRETAQTSQQIVATDCGISRQAYQMIESGVRTPSVKVAKKIAEVLNFDWNLFFADENRETA